MPDDLKRRKPEDPKRINVNQTWEVRYWTKELGCSEAQLRSAVNVVGVMVDKVRIYLQTH